jgi:hypothetical protein
LNAKTLIVLAFFFGLTVFPLRCANLVCHRAESAMSIKVPTHLYRNRHGTFYFRIVIPQDLQEQVQQREFRFRLYTEGKGSKQPVTKAGDCKGPKSAKVMACLQPDRRVDIEIIGTSK